MPQAKHNVRLWMVRLALLGSAGISAGAFAQARPPADPLAPDPVATQSDATATAPEQPPQADSQEIVVTGARASQRSSIDAKRDSDLILDGIVNDEVGALPDNSVGDTLERITGVTADRFKGNANELSIRGLGPTLSFSTFNGREVSSAGEDRSVAFSQFPSELVSGVVVYKSQQASFPEGGIAGVIELRALRPLDYGRRRIQAEVLGSFSPNDADIDGRSGFGYRANLSYIDQFDTGIGRIGISLGVQRQDQPASEDYYATNSLFTPCNTSANNPSLITGNAAALNAAGAGQNCAEASGPRVVSGTTIGETRGATYLATSSRTFRQITADEIRTAVLGTLQWQPARNLDIVLDGQYSRRDSQEARNQLAIAEGLRGLQPIDISPDGALLAVRGNSNIENQLERRERIEDYLGGGLAITWHPGRLTIAGDLSYSGSHRTETQQATRMRSTTRVPYELDYGDSVVPSVTFLNGFDVTDPANFLATAANSVYARNRFVTDRHDNIWAGRLDLTYDLDGFFRSLQAGVRYSEHHRTNDNARNNDLNTLVAVDGEAPAQLITDANANCRSSFGSNGFFSGLTNINSWATFDNDCLFDTFTGGSLPLPADGRDPSDIDVHENIFAVYGQANFRTALGDTPVFGNFGLRYVSTDVTSTGYRLPLLISIDTGSDSYSVIADPNGAIQTNTARGNYHYFLPSANLAIDFTRQLRLRLAAYRAIARSGIEDLGAGIDITPSSGAGGASDIVFNAATGNPGLRPLRSWNLDASLEFYPSPDTILSLALYNKWVTGAVIAQTEAIPTNIDATTIVDGGAPTVQSFTIFPVALANDPETRNLYGFEVTAAHAFTWLPTPLDGLGASVSYNRTYSNFSYPDTSAVAAFVDPAGLIGLSRDVFSGSVYWEKHGFSIRAFYRYRSAYFKPNDNTNRYVRGSGYLNLSAYYNITRSIQLRLQALNLTGTRDVFYKGVPDSITEVSETGPTYYFGVRVRF